MAITRPVRPEFIASGIVQGTRPVARKDSGEIIRTEVTVLGDNGAQFAIDVWPSSGLSAPAVLSHIVAVVGLTESAQYGPSLALVRYASDDDLDRLMSARALVAVK